MTYRLTPLRLSSLFAFLFVLTLGMYSQTAAAQNAEKNYTIDITIPQLKDTSIMLAYHYDGRQYLLDTADINSKGHGVFKGSKPLTGGVYLIVLPDKNYFEFLADGKQQNYKIKTSLKDPMSNLTVENSIENKAFIEHHKLMREQGEKIQKLRKDYESAKADKDKGVLRDKIKTADEESRKMREDLRAKYKGTFFSNLIGLMLDPVVPEAPKNPDGSLIDSAFAYKYYKSHYFDNVDFSDERLLRTPVFKSKLEYYMDKLVVPHPDSAAKEAIMVVEKSQANKTMFKYVLISLSRKYETSKMMCMDGVFVKLADRFYITKEADWVDSAQYAKIYDRIAKMRNNVCNAIAPEMNLSDTAGRKISLHKSSQGAEYTLIYFWTPTCGHCRKETPKVHEIYEKYKDKGLAAYAVYTEEEQDIWKKYIKEHNLKWNNIYDHTGKHYYKVYYDIYSTPVMYLLDKDKKIILKRITHEQLDDFLEKKLGNKMP